MSNVIIGDLVAPMIEKVRNNARTRQAKYGALMLAESHSKHFFIQLGDKIPVMGANNFTINFLSNKELCPNDNLTIGAVPCSNAAIGASNINRTEQYIKITESDIKTLPGNPIIVRSTDFTGSEFQFTDGQGKYSFDLTKKNDILQKNIMSSLEGMLVYMDKYILGRFSHFASSGVQMSGQAGAFSTNFITADANNGGSPTIQRNAFLPLAMQFGNGLNTRNFYSDISLLVPSNYADAIDNLNTYESVTNQGVSGGGTVPYISNAFKDSFMNGEGGWNSATVPRSFAVDSAMYAVKFVSRNPQSTIYNNVGAEMSYTELFAKIKTMLMPMEGRNSSFMFTIPYPIANGDFSYIPIDIRVTSQVDCNFVGSILIEPMLYFMELQAPNNMQCGTPAGYNGFIEIVGCPLPAIATCSPSAPFTPATPSAVTGATFPLAVGCNATGFLTFTDSLGNAVVTSQVSFPKENMAATDLVKWLNYNLSTAVPSVPYGSFAVNAAGTGIDFLHTNLPTRIVAPAGVITLNISGGPAVLLTVA